MRQWGTFIFIVNRYVGLLGHVPIIYSYFFIPSPDLVVGQQDSKCDPLHKYHQILAVVVQTCVGGTRFVVLPREGLTPRDSHSPYTGIRSLGM